MTNTHGEGLFEKWKPKYGNILTKAQFLADLEAYAESCFIERFEREAKNVLLTEEQKYAEQNDVTHPLIHRTFALLISAITARAEQLKKGEGK